MNVTLAVLADYANISREGKLNVLGIFDVINVHTFPVIHSQMQLVMRFEADIAEAGMTKKVDIKLIDAEGNNLIELSGELALGQVRPGELFRADHLLTISNMKFEKPGDYRFDIFINGEPKKQIPIKVVQLPPPA